MRESLVVDVVSPLDACVNAANACVETVGRPPALADSSWGA
jgi:hypothetical protein